MTASSAAPPGNWTKFLLPSLIGAFAFLFPVRDDGVFTIPMALLSGRLTTALESHMHFIVLAIIAVSAVVSTWVTLTPWGKGVEGRLGTIFRVSGVWLVIRLLGFAMAVMIVFQIGPEPIWADNTGRVVLFDLAKVIVTIFVVASFLMPLLTDYGLMELVGTVLSPLFRFAFRLPGRSCIDALASWMSSAPVGILITSLQYDKGNYSGREAAVIATNFSVVSVPFCVIVADFVGLSHRFLEYYMTVVLCGLVAAVITPRIPPLSRIPDDYSPAGKQLEEAPIAQEGLLRAGLNAALRKSADAPALGSLLRTAVHNLFDVWFGLMPALIAIGTTGLVVAEYTPFFQWLSYPLVWVLDLLQVPESAKAAPALVVGFADMFLPAVLASSIESELTRFVIASVSITQLIYMTEVGVMILKTQIPLNLLNLAQVFLLRTMITLPIAVAIAHLLFG